MFSLPPWFHNVSSPSGAGRIASFFELLSCYVLLRKFIHQDALATGLKNMYLAILAEIAQKLKLRKNTTIGSFCYSTSARMLFAIQVSHEQAATYSEKGTSDYE